MDSKNQPIESPFSQEIILNKMIIDFFNNNHVKAVFVFYIPESGGDPNVLYNNLSIEGMYGLAHDIEERAKKREEEERNK